MRHQTTVKVYVTLTEYDKIKDNAANYGLSVSSYLRVLGTSGYGTPLGQNTVETVRAFRERAKNLRDE